MNTVIISHNLLISVKDVNNDKLTEREEYQWAEFNPQSINQTDIIHNSPAKKLASFCCVHYNNNNYTIVTDNPVIIVLMVESQRIILDDNCWINIGEIPQKHIDNYFKLTN